MPRNARFPGLDPIAFKSALDGADSKRVPVPLPTREPMSTLIVRDATLAINGAPETRGEPAAHLEQRILEVSGMPADSLGECVEVLSASGGEDADLEALTALSIVGMAQPSALEEHGISPLAMGRRVAARLERDGDPEAALAMILALREYNPGHGALDRDYEAIVRRMGMVRNLADRYLARAEQLIRIGKEEEGVGWLREVLVLEPGRTDIARRIRNFRLKQEGRVAKRAGVPRSVLLTAILVPIGLAAVVGGDLHVRGVYDALPKAGEGSLPSMEARLAALEAFVDAYPVWTGSLGAVSERSHLRWTVGGLREQEEQRLRAEEEARQERADSAEILRQKGRSYADSGELGSARELFREALAVAPPDWGERQRLERDIEAINGYLSQETTEDGQ